MKTDFNFYELLIVGGVNFLILSLRYLLFAGLAYLIFWVWKRNKFLHKRIQSTFPTHDKIWYEVKYSFLTMIVFALVGIGIFLARMNGFTKIYLNISDYGYFYFFFSLLVYILFHDMYFYWTHRLMHHKYLFKYFHKVHHNSTDPSPWASFSFHPLEAIVEAGIVPIMVIMIPSHPLVIVLFLVYMTGMNVLGHLGFELYPKGFTKGRFGRFHNTSTHHNMHHKFYNSNFGLYFNFWDNWMNTNHKSYHETFESVASREKS